MTADLPFIDEHRLLVPAPAPAVWRSLARQFTPARLDSGQALAYVLGTDPRRATGTPFELGATLPGFAVSEVEPERLVRLTGHHRFSRYALVFTLTPEPETFEPEAFKPETPEPDAARPEGTQPDGTQPDRTLLSARSYAEFPGPHGWAYRKLVIGSGAHRVIVARMLRTIGDRASGEAARGEAAPGKAAPGQAASKAAEVQQKA